jgi:hypothetical protein
MAKAMDFFGGGGGVFEGHLDKTAFVKFKISNNFKQNIDQTHSKQPKIRRKIHTSLWILEKSKKKNPKSRNLLISQDPGIVAPEKLLSNIGVVFFNSFLIQVGPAEHPYGTSGTTRGENGLLSTVERGCCAP